VDTFTFLAAGAAVVGVLVAFWQVRAGQTAIKVQRVIDLHANLTTGEVGNARSRFTALMWKHGERQAGFNACHLPRWVEILPELTPEGRIRGSLAVYSESEAIATSQDAEPLRDLYAVLWCFERIEAGRAGGALDKRMLVELVAPHAIWWDSLTQQISEMDTLHVQGLRRLAKELKGVKAVRTMGLQEWADRDFLAAAEIRSRPST